MASIVDSLVAPLSVVNALVVALCMKKQKEVITTLETLEEIWDEYQVYNKDELNMVGEKMELSGARGEAEDAQTEVFGAREEAEDAQTEVSGARGDAGSVTQGMQKE